MMDTAIEKLKAEGYSCVVAGADGKVLFASAQTGITAVLEAAQCLRGAAVADKIIGRAAALICAYGGAAEVYGEVMSAGARAVLESHGIVCGFGTLTDAIINRTGDGICPMEKLVSDTDSPEEAYKLISEKVRRF